MSTAFFRKFSCTILFILLFHTVSSVSVLGAGSKLNDDPPMSFIIVRSAGCQTDCLEWVSGEGRITSDTPARLKKVLKSIGIRKLPIVLLSGGGDVDAALQMGRMIRKVGLETAVGATRLKGCPTMEPRCKAGVAKKGASEGQAFSWSAYCFSACPFMLAGGTVRSASQWSSLGVHQITTTRQSIHVTYQIQYKMVNGKKKEVSRKEVRRKLKDEGKTTKLSKKLLARLNAYFKEMGIDLNIMEFVSSVGPDNMRILSTVEALRLGLLTDMLASHEMPGTRLCTEKDGLEVRCHRRGPLPSAPGATAATAPPAALPAPVEQPAVAITTAREG